MGVVLLYYVYLFIITVVLGIGCTSLLKRANINPFLVPFFGGFIIALVAGIWAIWGNLGLTFEITLMVLTLLVGFLKKNVLRDFFFSLKAKLSSLPIILKFLLVIITVFALAQSASAPYVIDNESYYIQTIKWLDQYGYVPGLANFHFFLGQQSGWHILQSALNLDFISSSINDVNGFYLILANAYALDKLNHYRINKNMIHLAAGLFPVFNVFLFQFISAPSPDLAIYCITAILFTEFAEHYLSKPKNATDVLLLFLLVVFAVYIKVIAIFLIVFPALLYAKRRAQFKQDLCKLSVVSIAALAAFVAKNSIISGYPLYPLSFLKLQTDWTMPAALQQYLVDATKAYAFFITPEEYGQLSLWQRLAHWFTLPKLHGLFNKGNIVLLVLFPVVFRKKMTSKPYQVVYVITIVQLVFLWLSSPQYRFFMGYVIVLSTLILAQFLKGKRFTNFLLVASTLLVALPLFMPLPITQLTNNEFKQDLSRFSYRYFLRPHPQTKYTGVTYKNLTFGNLNYNTPTNIDFFWATGDCEVPCIQKQQLMDFKNYFEQAPQLRTGNLKDGFKSVHFAYE